MSEKFTYIFMKLFRNFRDIEASDQVHTLTIGNFDGLHQGHRALMAKAAERGPFGVTTFYPHPERVLFAQRPYFRLRPLEFLIEKMDAWGAKTLLAQNFDLDFSKWSAEEFCQRILIEAFHAQRIVVGFNFRFGHGRRGDTEFLQRFCQEKKMECLVVEPKEWQGQTVSTSRIKSLIVDGDVKRAHELLTEPYFILGVVESGDRRGRSIGFPTANVSLGDFVCPRWGVYFNRVHLPDGKVVFGVSNIGVRPTVHQDAKANLEVHVLDYGGELYGQEIKVEFLHRIREEKKFSSVAELTKQIQNDVRVARDFAKHLKE